MNNSSVELQKSDIRLKIVLSIGGMICLVVLALIFQDVAVYLIAGFGTVAMVGYGTTIWFKFQDNRRLQRRREAETRLAEQEAAQAMIVTHRLKLASSFHETKIGVFVPKNTLEEFVFVPATATERREAGLLPATIETMPNLLDEIRTEQCVMFLGPRDSGKTTLALHWLSVRDTQAVVCDVKGLGLNPWPPNCQVVSETGDILRVSQFVLSEMQQRREKQLINESSLTLFFDELHYLVSAGIEVLHIAVQIATLGREYNVHAGFTSHADTVKYLRVDGAALLENFTKVRTTKKHICYLDFGEGEFQVIPPGPYNAPAPIHHQDQVSVPMTEAEMIENAIIAGHSNNQICRDVWGSKNSDRIARINAIREGLQVV